MTLLLEIMQPDGMIAQAEALAVRAVDATGSFGLLPGHEDFCTALAPSILIYRENSDRECYVAVDGGVLVLEDNRVSVVTRDAVLFDDMDHASEAVSSMLQTRREQEREASKTFSKLVAELLEQMPQLRARQ
ncbi:MAG TPA: F0F1 ATP synthase subunit epsilon [Chloroflexota bacterium]